VRAEEKALISLFEEGGRGEPRPPDLPGKRKPLNRGLTLLSFQGDEAFVSFPRPPRLGEALLPSGRPSKLLLQVVWAKAEEEDGSPGPRSAAPGTEFFPAGMRRSSRLALPSPKPRAQRFSLAGLWKEKNSPRAEGR
jgi:hypothetical protein